MKVILLSDHPKFGQKNSVVKVSDGYGRNFLIPKKLAIYATPKNLKILEKNKIKNLESMKLEVKKYLELKEKLEKITFFEKVKFTKGGDLIKNISKKHLATIIKEQADIKLDKKVFPSNYVFASGKNTITLELFPKINASIILNLIEESNG